MRLNDKQFSEELDKTFKPAMQLAQELEASLRRSKLVRMAIEQPYLFSQEHRLELISGAYRSFFMESKEDELICPACGANSKLDESEVCIDCL